ncbi:MAG: hypothetical protein KAY29_02790 [Brevundimonas sp.]|nr:hypothetical protein [Brevundimonas sp.]
MKTLTSLLAGATLIALSPAVAAADDSDMSVAVHDILVTSNIPAINISVRNLSPSTIPAMRNLRVTSPRPVIRVAGQVWCKAFQTAHIRADAAQVIFGNASLHSLPEGGAGVHPLGIWSSSPIQALGGDELLRNYNINAPVDFPETWEGGISLGFNPVREVEKRMEQFVQNGGGTEADFLRVDDVFETTIKMNAVGWCDYDSGSHQYRYAGYRQIDVPVHIFYHGDPDIEDQVTAVGSSGTIQAPPPPGRRGREAPPPRRRDREREREPQEARGDVFIAIPDIDGEDSEALIVPAVQRQQDSEETRAGDDRGGSTLGDTIRREAARAAIGALLGSGRSSRESRPQARPAPPRSR